MHFGLQVAQVSFESLNVNMSEPLGGGAFGITYLGTLFGCPVVVKLLKADKITQQVDF